MKISTYVILFFTLLSGTVAKAQSAWITYPVGHEAALDILFNMPGNSLVNTSIGWSLAEQAGNAVWKDYGYLGTNVPASVRGTNGSGRYDLSVTIHADLSYTGSITGQAGIPVAQISGTLEGQVGGGVSGTFNLFFSWETLTDMEGKIYVEYKIGVGAEVRTGHLETEHIIEELRYNGQGQPPVVSPAEAEASAANGGRLVYKYGINKYYNVVPLSVFLFTGGGSVILWPIEFPDF